LEENAARMGDGEYEVLELAVVDVNDRIILKLLSKKYNGRLISPMTETR
jgi:hypothetical protein